MPDIPGPAATGRDATYSLSIDDAVLLYARAGHPRTPRSVQRYCASGHLDAVKETTVLGDKYAMRRGRPRLMSPHRIEVVERIAVGSGTGYTVMQPNLPERSGLAA
jgi:hypothetical protein